LKQIITNKPNGKRGAVILAGGDSKRLGQPKALLDINGKRLIEMTVDILSSWFDQLTLVTDRAELYSGLPVILTADLISNRVKSPLRGIHAGLSVSKLPYQFVVACDMPFLNLDLIRYLESFASNYDAVVPRIGSYHQPLHAFYNRSCIEVIEEEIALGSYKVIDFYSKLNICYVGRDEIEKFDPAQQSFININTWSDYRAALKMMKTSSIKR
jgi:molybdenum cofactor guanylyltransferase